MTSPYRIATYNHAGEYRGMLKPAILRFDSANDAETVAHRWRENFPMTEFRVVEINERGDIVRNP